MPRQARLDTPGTLHHVIVRGIDKRRIANDSDDRINFMSRLGQLAIETRTAIYAWSLMTNHAHLLLRSGPHGLSEYMRRLLTGYAITYNRRHSRHGHLFQNRYKSIVCDEDTYFRELVRYIHLNPLRAGLVKSFSVLERYPWCGHGALMGRLIYDWQDCEYVLSWFGNTTKKAQPAYNNYVQEGIAEGKRPELVGGGLIRSLGGWSEVKSLRRSKEKVLTDGRILGSGDFVDRILKDSVERLNYQFKGERQKIKIKRLIEEECEKAGINISELTGGSRRGRISQVRAHLSRQLVKRYGLPLAETARQLGVSTTAISKIILRSGQE